MMDITALKETFSVPEIGEYLNKYLKENTFSREDLDKSILSFRESILTPLSEATTKIFKDNGVSSETIERIASEEEAEIYNNAKLEVSEVKGKEALVKTDIDIKTEDDLGRTNLERMQSGLAPLDQNGNPLELHHIGQNADSPLAELTREEHRGKGNDLVLHDKTKESEIDRQAFGKERQEHWKARAEQLAS